MGNIYVAKHSIEVNMKYILDLFKKVLEKRETIEYWQGEMNKNSQKDKKLIVSVKCFGK
ncbi:hypothetical protein [Halonatronum saccharophilum]|uniref:hypothetical protein n=1 Tax=Halonatronum saccharophilum TaxID=150060 RepID=UPI0004B455FB|nr:hypothetical protein [Halonatronum saccharophilum]